jgi:hypothetical protein
VSKTIEGASLFQEIKDAAKLFGLAAKIKTVPIRSRQTTNMYRVAAHVLLPQQLDINRLTLTMRVALGLLFRIREACRCEVLCGAVHSVENTL